MTSHPALDPAALMPLLATFAGRRVLCIGDTMIDRFIYGDVRRISPEAPVPVIRITREHASIGGAGNVVRNLSALGALPYYVSVVGDDAAGREAALLLGGIDGAESYLRVSAARETTIKNRFLSSDGHHLLRADRENPAPLSDKDLSAVRDAALTELKTSDALIISDYGKGFFANDLAATLIAAARASSKPVIVDPKGTDYARYAGATVITPNRAELAEATSLPATTEAQIILAGEKLRQITKADTILVTRSEEGMTIVADKIEHLSAERHEVRDVTGAGDTVVATVAVALAGGARLADAARLANIAAGIVVNRRGTAVATIADISANLVHSGIASLEEKIADRDSAAARAESWRRQSLKVGFTNGCFDLLHPGHVALLRQARSACDRLIVGLNSDASVRRLKGEGRPVQTAAARSTVLASMSTVDLVVVFDEDTPQALIEALRPDVLVKGADYARGNVVGADFVESYGGKVILAELVEGPSTTATIAAMKAKR